MSLVSSPEEATPYSFKLINVVLLTIWHPYTGGVSINNIAFNIKNTKEKATGAFPREILVDNLIMVV
jgi:hypothetical protein